MWSLSCAPVKDNRFITIGQESAEIFLYLEARAGFYCIWQLYRSVYQKFHNSQK